MKPEIFEVTNGGKRHAFLVDSDIQNKVPHEGIPRWHYPAAIEISDLQAGQLRLEINPENGGRVYSGPRCCLMVAKPLKQGAKPRKLPPESRGFDRRAAEVLLELAAACNDLRFGSGLKRWDFFGPAEKGFAHPWDELKFLAAWRFSAWELASVGGVVRPLTGDERYADMVGLGYPHTPATLRKMLARMGLVRPKPGKESGPTWSL